MSAILKPNEPALRLDRILDPKTAAVQTIAVEDRSFFRNLFRVRGVYMVEIR